MLGGFASVFLLAKTIMLDVELMMLLRKVHFGGIVNFHASWRYVGGFTQWIPVIFWLCALVLTVAAIAVVFDTSYRWLFLGGNCDSRAVGLANDVCERV